MPWRNHQTKYYQPNRPTRVRLSDGTTRTNEEVTDQLLADLGWQWEEPEQEPEQAVEIITTATSDTIE